MPVYYPEQMGGGGGGSGGGGVGQMMQAIANQRLERQRAAEEQAKLLADLQAKLAQGIQSIGADQFAQLPDDIKAKYILGGQESSDPATQAVLEQIMSGETPAKLRSPEMKLEEAGRQLGNTVSKIETSEGGGGWDFGDVFKPVGNVLGRAADVISRPTYGVMNYLDNVVDYAESGELKDVLNLDVLRGLAGTKKTTGSDVMVNALDLDDEEYKALPSWAKAGIFATGLAADVALDPLTYTGAGLVKKVADAGDAAKAALTLTKGPGRAAVKGVKAAPGVEATGVRALTEGYGKAAPDITNTLTDVVNQTVDEVIPGSLGLRGTRELAEQTGTTGGRVPFQPQGPTAQTAVLADRASLEAAKKAKTIEGAAVGATSESANLAAERAARFAMGQPLPYSRAELGKLSKAQLQDLAAKNNIDLAGARTHSSMVSKIRADPAYRAASNVRASELGVAKAEMHNIMYDANQRVATEHMVKITKDRTLALKFQSPMGRKVWGQIELPGFTKHYENFANKLLGTEAGQWAAKVGRSLSRIRKISPAVWALERYHLHAAYGDVIETMKANANYFDSLGMKKLTVDDNKNIVKALLSGDLDSLADNHRQIAEGFMLLEDTNGIARLERGMLRRDELIHREGRTSYVPLFFKKYVPPSVRRDIRKARISGQTMDEIWANPKWGQYEKHMETDLGKIAAMSARDQSERLARYNLWKDLNDKFFLDARKIKDPGIAAKAKRDALNADFVPLRKVAEDIGSDDLHRLFGDLDVDEILVPPELQDGLKNLTSWQYVDKDVGALKATYMNIMRTVKLSLTMANPGFHLRNLRGDILLNAMDGTVDPRQYKRAMKLLRMSGDVRYQNLPTTGLDQVAAAARQANAGTDFAGMSVVPGALPTKGIDVTGMATMKFGGVDVPADQVLRLFNESGGRTGFTQAEIERAVGNPTSRSIWQRGKAAVAQGSEWREEMPRLAHFIDKLDVRMKEAGITARDVSKNTDKFKEAVQRAGADVRKFNYDYSDLTRQEQTIKNAAIPFYTWMRKNIALQAEMLFTRPAFAAGWSNGVKEAQKWMERDPYGNEITPAWIDEMIGIPMGRISNDAVAAGLGFLGLGQTPFAGGEMGPMDNTLYMTPFGDMPFANALEPFEAVATLFDGSQAGGFQGAFRPREAVKEAAKYGFNILAPQIKIPTELATGVEAYTGGPAAPTSPGELGGDVSPFIRTIRNLAGMGEGDPDPQADIAGFFRWLLASNAQMVTPRMKTGDVSRRTEIADPLWEALKESRMADIGIDLSQKVPPR